MSVNIDMPTISRSYWKIIDQSITCLCDPRVNITKHIAWSNHGTRATAWPGIEPDNYNFAIFDQRPHELEFVKDQCWYKIKETFRRTKIRGWMSVYYIPDLEQQVEFRRTILKIQPQAFWQYPKSAPLRTKRTMLERENNYKARSDTNFSTEERLWQLGYFENLRNKYFNDDERFIRVVGSPRGAVLNYQPEVDNETDYCDN